MQDNVKELFNSHLSKHSSNAFNPTDAHRRAKTAFWSHFFDSGDVPPTDLNEATAARFSGYNEVIGWWSTPGFREWFSNGEEFRQKVEYVSNLALDVLHSVLSSESSRTGDRLAAAKMALEIAAKFPKSAPKEKYADDKIAEMGKAELEQFIQSKLKSLKTVDSELEPGDTTGDK